MIFYIQTIFPQHSLLEDQFIISINFFLKLYVTINDL
jgi:hypothetical protein